MVVNNSFVELYFLGQHEIWETGGTGVAARLRDILVGDFRELRDAGLAEAEAIAAIARKHGMPETNVQNVLTANGALGFSFIRSLAGATDYAMAFGWKTIAMVTFGGFVGWLMFWNMVVEPVYAALFRPSSTELELSRYEDVCDRQAYKENCQGKFILWDGVVESGEDNFVRVRFGDIVSMDVQSISLREEGLTEFQHVKVSGWLADKNFIHPDIEQGKIIPLETADSASSRYAAEKAHLKREGEAYSRRMDDELSRCKTLDWSDGKEDRKAVSDCLLRSME